LDKKNLDITLRNILQNFRNEIDSHFPAGSEQPVTYSDLRELARRVNETLEEFREAIIRD